MGTRPKSKRNYYNVTDKRQDSTPTILISAGGKKVTWMLINPTQKLHMEGLSRGHHLFRKAQFGA